MKETIIKIAKYLEEGTIDENEAKQALLNLFGINDNNNNNNLTNSLPEWFDMKSCAEAKRIWDSHQVTDDGFRVTAIKFIQNKAKECGYTITISKALELFKTYCQ